MNTFLTDESFMTQEGSYFMNEIPYPLKICIIGNHTQLQTQFITNYTKRRTLSHLPTLGLERYVKNITINNQSIKLILVNTAGKQFFKKLRPSYYCGASAAIIIFDKNDQSSLDAVEFWYNEFKAHFPLSSPPIALVGIITGSDDLPSVNGQDSAAVLGVDYYEATPMDTEVIERIFHDLILKVLKKES
ncbi:MAG: hypothetical protein ACFFB2_20825 [Promethearchaeota archaeon]